jgi:hypothetical protein
MGGPESGPTGNVKWNGESSATGTIGTNAYTIEFRVPFKTLGVEAPRPGTSWGLNVCRNRPSRQPGERAEPSCWSQTGGPFHAPYRFGVLRFE